MVDAGSAGAVALSVLVFVVIVPLTIELFFRGIVHQAMVECFGAGRGMLAGAALYTVFVLSATWPKEVSPGWQARWAAAIVTALLWGLVLGAVRSATGSVLAAIVLHAAGNLLWVALVAGAEALPVAAASAPGRHVPWYLVLLALVSVGAGLALLRRAAWRVAPETATP
jgi:membrane protease YdiL (CAAX protease family)